MSFERKERASVAHGIARLGVPKISISQFPSSQDVHRLGTVLPDEVHTPDFLGF